MIVIDYGSAKAYILSQSMDEWAWATDWDNTFGDKHASTLGDAIAKAHNQIKEFDKILYSEYMQPLLYPPLPPMSKDNF